MVNCIVLTPTKIRIVKTIAHGIYYNNMYVEMLVDYSFDDFFQDVILKILNIQSSDPTKLAHPDWRGYIRFICTSILKLFLRDKSLYVRPANDDGVSHIIQTYSLCALEANTNHTYVCNLSEQLRCNPTELSYSKELSSYIYERLPEKFPRCKGYVGSQFLMTPKVLFLRLQHNTIADIATDENTTYCVVRRRVELLKQYTISILNDLKTEQHRREQAYRSYAAAYRNKKEASDLGYLVPQNKARCGA